MEVDPEAPSTLPPTATVKAEEPEASLPASNSPVADTTGTVTAPCPSNPTTPENKKTRDSIEAICSSTDLDNFLAKDTALKVSYDVPSSRSANFVSEKTTGMPIPDVEPTVVNIIFP